MISPSAKAVLVSALALLPMAAAGCAGLSGQGSAEDEQPSLIGTWTSSDGTPEKTFGQGEIGNCSGFFYNGGKPLDTGGPMTCQLSAAADDSGRYRLLVTQTGNRATYLVEFSGSDEANVYTRDGELLYSLTRF